jgi:hypothetical protein
MIGNARGDGDQIDIGCPDEVHAAAIRTRNAKGPSGCCYSARWAPALR